MGNYHFTKIPYDKIAIYNVMKTFNEKKELKITSSNVSGLDETLVIEFTENFLAVTGRFYPEVEGGKKLEKSDIIWLLNNRGVKFGIKEDVIEDFLEHRMYCTTYTLAEALAPVEGSDAELREAIAENVHEVWARDRKFEGWTYGPNRDDEHKLHPDMMPYHLLPESEKNYDRQMAISTIKLVKKLGWDFVKRKR